MYKVTEVLGDWEAQYGKRRVAFKVEGNPNKISGFFMVVPQEGDELEGEIVQKGEYWNFVQTKKTFQKGGTAPDMNRVELKVDRAIAMLSTLGGEITGMKGVLGDILSKVDPAIKNEPF